MRFLKRKIALSSSYKTTHSSLSSPEPTNTFILSQTLNHNKKTDANPKKRRRLPGFSFTPESVKETKNIVLNYGRAISSFAVSNLALSYLEPLLEKEGVTLEKFKEFVMTMKKQIGGICSFRSMLMTSESNNEEEVKYKRIYRMLAEIFIKMFSVNWISHGKMGHKDTYLKYRFKMLRRVRNPEWFTYLKGDRKKKRVKC